MLSAFRSFCIFFLLFSCIQADDPIDDAPSSEEYDPESLGLSLVDRINGTVPRVHDTVSIISGAWVESSALPSLLFNLL